jgi:phosphoglycolate phosphatase-like HAD superfamily hydrolase
MLLRMARQRQRGSVKVVFFDIDGTLLHMDGAGRRAFTRALRRVQGWDDPIEYINFAGATDLQVLDEVAARHGRTLDDQERRRFFDVLVVELERAASEVEPVVHPGVAALVERLAAREDVLVGLVTGNEARCARVKLRHFHLHGHFLLGAFGHEHADRAEIARLALRRAERRLAPRRPGKVFLIGDTPNDIAAARGIGGTSIAVATGGVDEQALRAAGADHVLPDLGDGERVAALLGV